MTKGRPKLAYDTPIGVFIGLKAAAKALNISVKTLQNRIKDDYNYPEYYKTNTKML